MEGGTIMFENDDNQQNYSNNTPEKSRKTNWLPWLLAAGLGVLLVFQYIGAPGSTGSTAVAYSNGFRWLPILAGLICPLMMLFMMSGHTHGGNHANRNDQGGQNGSSGQGGCCGGHQTK